MCSASFSSINRLLSHNQIITCDKFFCNHCEKIFDFKNKFHNYIRNHKCQKLLSNKSDVIIKIVLTKLFISEKNVTSAIKNLTSHDSDLASLFISETIFNDANIVIKKGKITHLAAISVSVAKSISVHKSNLSALVSVESIVFKITIIIEFFLSSTNSSLTYRAISSSSFIYKLYKKPYLIIVDLYIRYTSLSKSQARNKITRIITVLSVIFI